MRSTTELDEYWFCLLPVSKVGWPSSGLRNNGGGKIKSIFTNLEIKTTLTESI